MLTFKKNYRDTSSSFAIAEDGTLLIVSRIIDSKGYALEMSLDNTVRSLSEKVTKVIKMPNDEFKLFSSIQANVEEVSDAVWDVGNSMEMAKESLLNYYDYVG